MTVHRHRQRVGSWRGARSTDDTSDSNEIFHAIRRPVALIKPQPGSQRQDQPGTSHSKGSQKANTTALVASIPKEVSSGHSVVQLADIKAGRSVKPSARLRLPLTLVGTTSSNLVQLPSREPWRLSPGYKSVQPANTPNRLDKSSFAGQFAFQQQQVEKAHPSRVA